MAPPMTGAAHQRPGVPDDVGTALRRAAPAGFGHSCTEPVGRLPATLALARVNGRIAECGTGFGVGTAWLRLRRRRQTRRPGRRHRSAPPRGDPGPGRLHPLPGLATAVQRRAGRPADHLSDPSGAVHGGVADRADRLGARRHPALKEPKAPKGLTGGVAATGPISGRSPLFGAGATDLGSAAAERRPFGCGPGGVSPGGCANRARRSRRSGRHRRTRRCARPARRPPG